MTDRLFAIAALLFVFLTGPTLGAQEGLYEGETLFGQGTRLSEKVKYTRRDELFSGSDKTDNPLGREFEEIASISGVHYGVKPEFTASLLIPYIEREAVRNVGGSRVKFEDSGWGDSLLLGKYRLHKKDWKKGSLNVSLAGGLEVPTGDVNERDGGRELPSDLQLGSESWDPVFAAGTSLEDEPYKLDATLLYKENLEGADDYERGDRFDFELKAGYRFYLTETYPGPAGKVRVGFRWKHEGEDKQDGTVVQNTGSDVIYLRNQIIYHPTVTTDFSFSLQLPIYEDYEGEQTGGGYLLSFTAGYRF